jgi:hypothetical protein
VANIPFPEHIVRGNVVNRQTTKSPSFASLYTNDIQIQTSPWDLRLIFGQLGEVDAEKASAEILQVAEVRMSPQLAKRLAVIIEQQIQNYEATIGAVPLPPEKPDEN